MSFSKTIRSLVVFTPSAHGFQYGPLCEHLRLLCHELNIQLHTITTFQLDHASHLLSLAQVDAAIVIQNALSSNHLQALLEQKLPLISIGHQTSSFEIDAVLHNNKEGVVQAYTHLYEQGHREIAYVGNQDEQNMLERLNAFKECLLAYGKSQPSKEIITVSSQSFTGGHEAAELLLQMEPMPTAVICGNDLQAIGLEQKLREHGWYAPDQIAIIGFEGLTIGQQHKPQLSTVKVDQFALAEAAIERLLARAKYADLPPLELRIDCKLQPSQSCGTSIQATQVNEDNPSTPLTNAYQSTHENLSSALSELLSLNSELGQFMQWACVARWQESTSKPTLKLVEMQGNFTLQKLDTLVGTDACPAEQFPRKEWLAPYVGASAQLLSIPLSVNEEPWGILCLAGTLKNSRQLSLYPQFAAMAGSLAERIERNALEGLLKQKDHRSQFLQKRLHQAHQRSNEGLWEWDLQKDQVLWNDRAIELLGLEPEQWQQQPKESFMARIHLHDRAKVQRRLNSYILHGIPFSVTFRMTRPDGSLRWYAASGEAVSGFEEKPTQLIGTIQDTTEKRRSRHQFQMKVNQDPITGLPNRVLVSEQLNLQIQRNPEQTLAVFQLGLDRFKHLNSRFSHEEGDKLLQLVGQKLKSSLREHDFFARYNGDEFICLCPIDNQRQALGMANRLRRLLEQPLQQELGLDFYATASIGVALFPDHADTPTDLLRRADIAMRQAKENGKNQVVLYKSCIQADRRSRARIDNELRKAIRNNELTLAYQPQHSPVSNQLIGVEALLRWHSKELGNISPAEFIPLAEENGQIVELGYWVLREACSTLREWQRNFDTELTMSVNVSAGQLSQPSFLKQALQLIQSSGIKPQQLVLEITESTAIADIDNVRASLETLASQGIQIALDDFGTGYSSISLLRQLPLSCLKIDRSFFNKLQKGSQDWHLVKAIQELASALGHKVVAEGIETLEQLELVRELNCDLVQGYFYSRPLEQTALESRYFPASTATVQQLA